MRIALELCESGFVLRYPQHGDNVDSLPSGEGAFLACTFWLADNYALAGRQTEARETFERLLSLRNDVGLLAVEYDVVAGRQVGNFPQAFPHVPLINTARSLTIGGGPPVNAGARKTKWSDGKRSRVVGSALRSGT